MDRQDKQLERFLDGLVFDDAPDPQHRNGLERRLFTKLSESPQRHRVPARIWRLLMKNRITQLATAATIAVALLVPLSYATNAFVTRLIGGAYGNDGVAQDFQLDRDIRLDLQVGTKEYPSIISTRNIRFFVEDGEIRGSLRFRSSSWPAFSWRTRIELLDIHGNKLSHTEHVSANPGVELPESSRGSVRQDMRFSLGIADNVSRTQRFRIYIEEAKPDEPLTADAWTESQVLPVVRGRVTYTDGEPIPAARIQFNPGVLPAPNGSDVGRFGIVRTQTDRQGFYSIDGISASYRPSAIIYELGVPAGGYRHQFLSLNEVQPGPETLNFTFDRFPTGTAVLSGTAIDPNGAIAKEFSLDVRLHLEREDDPSQPRYQYGFQQPFVSSDGNFRITNMPAGVFDVTITPTPNAQLDADAVAARRHYVCELNASEQTVLDEHNAAERIWHGRITFEDGSPAALDLPGRRFQVFGQGRGYPWSQTIAIADNQGYFAAAIPAENMEWLRSGQAWLAVGLGDSLGEALPEAMVPLDTLSATRDTAGVLIVCRPHAYHGRVLYENGEPGVPPSAPSPELVDRTGADVWITLQDPAASSHSGGTGYIRAAGVDENGYFTIYLTDEQLRRIEDGQLRMQVHHPTYEVQNASGPIVDYPAELLAGDGGNIQSFVVPYSGMPAQFGDLKSYVESGYRLKELATALEQYVAEHNGTYPSALQFLSTDAAKLGEGIEYLPLGAVGAATEPQETVLAYDRTLLDATGNTHVLFADGHLEFCRPRRLEILGIRKPEISTPR